MAMNTVRRIASEVLRVGECKIKFRPEDASKISDALTREDVRGLIKDGAIYAISPRGVSRLRGREKSSQMKKGRRFGQGSRKGTYGTRVGRKSTWMGRVRAQRKYLFMLVEGKKIRQDAVRKVYGMIKGNAFKGVKVMDIYLRDNKLMVEKKQQ